jgi:hypothetical protein
MRLLFTGRGTSGSFQIRGVQLGEAMGATVEPRARSAEGYDAAILVKRAEHELLQTLRRAKVPIVWDIVDSWPQPDGNNWGHAQCMAWLSSELARIAPQAVIAPTRAMADDVRLIARSLPVLALPHHHRPGLAPVPAREVRTVGYEGGEGYIAASRVAIEAQCVSRGMRFVVNPQDVTQCDVLLAWRDADGYAVRNWKSNVKSATAHALGIPIICRRESGYKEMACGNEIWVDSVEAIGPALITAKRMGAQSVHRPYSVQDAARTLTDWLLHISTHGQA